MRQHDCSAAVRAHVADLGRSLPAEVAAEGPFDLVVCQRYREPRLYAQLASALAPGGVLVISVLSQVGNTSVSTRFRASPSELRDAFSPLLEVVGFDEGGGSSVLVGRRRPAE